MPRWLRVSWQAMWVPRPFAIRSPLAVPEAVAALDADRATAWTAVGLSSRGAGLYRVTGAVKADGVRLTARRGSRQSAFRPTLRAVFTPLPEGCELTGSFTVRPADQALAVGWLAFAVVLALVGLCTTGGLEVLLVGIGLGALGLTVCMVGALAGLTDEEHLRGWIERRLGHR